VAKEENYELEPITVTGTRMTPGEARRSMRKRQRLERKELRIEANIDRLYNKLETIEQKRDPYSRGGVAKPN
jgi:hypothetical protein|tara:strand:+ start:1231 stop:1446 length:216 start_codon:yes stop_codon:yes gene_type:complete